MQTSQRPIKTIQDKRMAYLVSLSKIYENEGYTIRLDGFKSILEIYQKGVILCQEISLQNSEQM